MITPRQAELHKASFELADGSVYFRDPFNGERLSPGGPPSSIEQQPDLKLGLDYLRQHRSEIKFTILASNHGDLDVLDESEVRGVLSRHDAIFLELFGHNKDAQDLFWQTGYGKEPASGEETYNILSGYKRQQLDLLRGVDKPVMLPEPAFDGTDYESDLCAIGQKTEELQTIVSEKGDDAVLILEVSLASETIMREWFMIAKMGSYMQFLEGLGGSQVLKPLLWIGGVHAETMLAKFRGLGLTVNVITPEKTSKRTPPKPLHGFGQSIAFVDAVRDARARIEQ